MYLFVPLYLMSCTIKEGGKKGIGMYLWSTRHLLLHQPTHLFLIRSSACSIWSLVLQPLRPVHPIYLCGTYVNCCLLRFCVSLWACLFVCLAFSPTWYLLCSSSKLHPACSPLIYHHNLLCLSCLYYKPNSTWSPESGSCFWVQIVSGGCNTLGTFLEMLFVILRESVPVCIY